MSPRAGIDIAARVGIGIGISIDIGLGLGRRRSEGKGHGQGQRFVRCAYRHVGKRSDLWLYNAYSGWDPRGPQHKTRGGRER